MPFDRLNKDLAIIAKLDDEPNDVTGLTAAELKGKFDEGGQALKEYINDSLLPALEGQGAAGELGAAPFGRVTGTNVQDQLRQVADSVEQVALGQIPDKSIGSDKLADGAVTPEKIPDGSVGPEKLIGALQYYHFTFDPEDWTVLEAGSKAELRVARAVHGLPTGRSIVARTLHMRIHRSARDYDADGVDGAKIKFVALQAAALAANSAAAGTYPVAGDGHVMLTWDQVQYYLLEETLVTATEAAAKAAELGFDWRETDTLGVPETVTLEQLLSASYLPALGGSSTVLDGLWSLEALRGLRFRAAVEGKEGESKKYDLFGRMSGSTWGVYESSVYIDTGTGELVLAAAEPYSGELLVIAGRGEG